MFISSTEKASIQESIESLRAGLAGVNIEILYLKAKIKALEDKGKPLKQTEEQLQAELKKARQRAYGRAYYQRKKEKERNEV